MAKFIGTKTIEAMKGMAAELLDIYEEKLDVAFMKTGEEGKLKVGISFDIALSASTANAVDVDATITFTADKVKDKIQKTGISESQGVLFDAVDAFAPKKGSGIDSVTFSAPGHKPVTLEAR